MPETMKAGQFNPVTQKVEINTVPIPEPDEVELLVKIVGSTLCHSDLMLWYGGFSGDPTKAKPVTMGHEASGIVEKIGKNATGFKVGDRVGFLCNSHACFKCAGCQWHNLFCLNETPQLQGFNADGYFAEYSAVDYRNAIVLPEEMDLKSAAPLFCAGLTAFHAINGLKQPGLDIKPGEWVAVVGCGGLGQLGIQYGKAMGYRIIAIDISEGSLALAKEAGAEICYNTLKEGTTYLEDLKKATDGGVHAACVFSNAMPAYTGAIAALRIGGVLQVVGIAKDPLPLTALDICMKKYRVSGANSGLPHQMPECVNFSNKHHVVSKVKWSTLDDLPSMVEELKSGKVSGRVGVAF